jgi:hypothetical protein
MPLDFDTIFAKIMVWLLGCNTSQNSNWDCPPPNEIDFASKVKIP